MFSEAPFEVERRRCNFLFVCIINKNFFFTIFDKFLCEKESLLFILFLNEIVTKRFIIFLTIKIFYKEVQFNLSVELIVRWVLSSYCFMKFFYSFSYKKLFHLTIKHRLHKLSPASPHLPQKQS